MLRLPLVIAETESNELHNFEMTQAACLPELVSFHCISLLNDE